MAAQPADTPKAVRVQMVGDVGVGKTSLILSLISEEFFDARCLSLPPADDAAFCQTMNSSFSPSGSGEQCDRLVSACEDILIPAEITITRTPCIICDLPANSSDDAIQEAIKMADVICIVYSCTYEQSKHNIADRWIPLILGADEQQTDSKSSRKPAIIVASKCDLSRDHGILTDAFIDALIEQHGWIHCRIECSALRMHNIAELFYYAQKVVLYPVDPLFDCASKRLRADFQLALRHIFHILDRRQTGRLDDDALNRLQQLAVASGYICSDGYRNCLSDGRRCKNRPDSKLTADDFDLLKKMLTSNDDSVALLSAHDHDRRLDQNEITERGFLCLFSLLLQRDLSETVWALIGVFFDGQLRFHSRDEEQLRRLEVSGSPRGLPISVELSDDSLRFIRSLYKGHKAAQQRAFSWPSPESINEAIFKFLEPPPNHLELRYNVRHPTSDKPVNSEYLSEEQFVLWWAYQVHDDPRKALMWLSQLGFDFWMTDIENGSLWCPSSFTVVQGPTVDHQYGGGSFVCTIFSEPKQSANLLLRDLAGRTMPDGDLQEWLVCSLGKCQHCFGCKEKALVLKSLKGGRGDVSCTDWVRSSHLLILICDLADEDSCQQVLNLCCTLGAPQGTEKSSALGNTNDFHRQTDGQNTSAQNVFPQLLLIAINTDRRGENNVHLETIRRMKATCPNLWGLPLAFNSKQIVSGEWADRILEHIRLCLTKCAGRTLSSRAFPATLSATLLSFPSSVLTGTQDFLWALTSRLRSFEQPQALLDRLRFCVKDRRALYSYYWCVVLGTSAVFGCIAVILLKHFGRRSLSSAGITRSIFI